MWETEESPNDVLMMRKMKDIGAGQISIEGNRLWTNSEVIIEKVMEEKERRKWRQEKGITPNRIRPWGSILKDATVLQIEKREMDDFQKEKRTPGRILMSEAGKESWDAVYYMDSEGEFWDEVSNKKLNKNGVIAARLDEIKQVHTHGVYEKVPIEECWNQTGKAPIKTKWVDINKGDELNEELRSRLVAK